MDKQPGFRKRIALELFRSLKRNRTKLHQLTTLFWECTLKCNLSCRHCGSGDCHALASQADMPVADFLKVIDEITPHVDPRKLKVILTGGEVLMRNDIETCGEELSRRGYPWGIRTNGFALTRERLDSLLVSGMKSLTIHLDGFEKAHNWLHQHPKSFEKALDAICMLTEETGLDWDVRTYANQRNLKELKLFKDFLIEINVKKWRIFTTSLPGKKGVVPEMLLADELFTWLLTFIRYCRKEGKIETSYGCDGFLGNYEAEVRDQLFHCISGIETAAIQADGSISGCPCVGRNYYQGNIYKDSFMEVWNNKFELYRQRAWAQQGECADCKMFRYCEGSGMHLHDGGGKLITCHYKRIISL